MTPVGVPTKAMLTMATSPTEYISPQRSSNPTTTDKSSFTLKESLVADSSIRCLKNKSSNPTKDLRTIPTRIHPNATNTANAVNAIAVVYPAVDDDDPDPNELPTDENALTFLTEWDTFYDDFVQSSNSILARSANSNLPSLADAYVRSTQTPQITNGHSQSLHQLLQVLDEMDKVNDQLSQLISALPSPAPYQPSPQNLANNSPQPRMCPAPAIDRTPQYVPPCVTPSAPNPAAIPLQQSTTPHATQSARLNCILGQPSPEPQLDSATQYVPLQETPPALHPLPPPTQQHASPSEKNRCIDQSIMHCVPPSPPTRPSGPHANPPKTTIPNWARPAVTAALFAGNPHWPPPRPNLKTTPYKKKSPAKHTVMPRTRDKDSLRPP